MKALATLVFSYSLHPILSDTVDSTTHTNTYFVTLISLITY